MTDTKREPPSLDDEAASPTKLLTTLVEPFGPVFRGRCRGISR